MKIILFNNQIYGLTKGQYSPTCELGKITKSTPFGSADYPIYSSGFALAAGASFVGRTVDVQAKEFAAVLKAFHKGGAFTEVYQNCNVFNDDAFAAFTDRGTKEDRQIFAGARQAAALRRGQEQGAPRGSANARARGRRPRRKRR